MIMSKIAEYVKDKKILILGLGREGMSTYNYLRRHLPEKHLTVADKNEVTVGDDKNVSYICGDDFLDCLSVFDIVFKSPGIAFLKDDMYPATTEITCQTDMFLRFCEPTVVGITGSKGKTTTSTLIYEMIKATGKRCCLIGNIGVPVFEEADEGADMIAVVEMSSHQLEFTKASPHIAVLVNIYEEHLDHYKTGFSGYAGAKLNITRFQNKDDFFIFNPEQKVRGGLDVASVSGGTLLPVGFSDAENDEFVNELWKASTHLKGEHNRQDIAYAVKAARALGADDASIRRAVKNFKGIEHRMELVGTFSDITYYNDSIATIPTAVEGAVNAIGNVSTLIFGGLDRGIDYSEFISFLKDSDIENLIGLPETGHKIIDALGDCDKALIKARDMEDAVKNAVLLTKKKTACLFSPAAASYNYYKNFEEKGKHFKSLVYQYNNN